MNGRIEYLVKWVNWDSVHNTWEPGVVLLEDCPAMVKLFEETRAFEYRNARANKTESEE